MTAPRRLLGEDERRQTLHLLAAGRDREAVARELGVAYSHVQHIAAAHGWPDRNRLVAAVTTAGSSPPAVVADPPEVTGRVDEVLRRALASRRPSTVHAARELLLKTARLRQALTREMAEEARLAAEPARRRGTTRRKTTEAKV